MAIVYTKTKDFQLDNETLVRLKEMGNISEISYVKKRNLYCHIKLLDKDHYALIDYATGEISDVYECKHIKNRSENLFQVGQSLKRLRDKINTNVVDPSKCLWVTLTYAENMTDHTRLQYDFQKFFKKLRFHYSGYQIEYILAREPQGRGAWHMHVILIFDRKAPYIKNSIIADLWGLGFTKTQKLNDIDNVGAYLTAYLGDFELNKTNLSILSKESPSLYKMAKNGLLATKEIEDPNGNKKKFIKGARLYLYPPKFNLYCCSKGIKEPTTELLEYFDAKLKVGFELVPTYKTCIHLEDLDKHFSNTYAYEYYNKLR